MNKIKEKQVDLSVLDTAMIHTVSWRLENHVKWKTRHIMSGWKMPVIYDWPFPPHQTYERKSWGSCSQIEQKWIMNLDLPQTPNN